MARNGSDTGGASEHDDDDGAAAHAGAPSRSRSRRRRGAERRSHRHRGGGRDIEAGCDNDDDNNNDDAIIDVEARGGNGDGTPRLRSRKHARRARDAATLREADAHPHRPPVQGRGRVFSQAGQARELRIVRNIVTEHAYALDAHVATQRTAARVQRLLLAAIFACLILATLGLVFPR
jgi:hypothetical protein